MTIRRLDAKTVLLLGTGRSGTTWLASMLAGSFRHRLLFEPFQPHQVPGAEVIADRHFDPARITPEVIDFCDRALNDRIDSEWIACNSNRRLRMHRWRFWPRVRVCKSVRTNLFLEGYRALFGDQLPIVVLVRHPGVVVESFLRVDFPWACDLSVLLAPNRLEQLEDALRLPLNRLLSLADTKAGALTLRWIVENAWLLKNEPGAGVHRVLYEDLRAAPGAVSDLCRQVGIETPRDLTARYHHLTWTTHPRSPMHEDPGSQMDWRARLDPQTVDRIQTMLEIAEVRYPPA